jgi:hypothetical protein
MLYVFMPPIKCWRRKIRALKKKLKIRDSNRRSDLNYDGQSNTHDSYVSNGYSDDDSEDDYPSTGNDREGHNHGRKNKDSILGGLEDNSSLSDEGQDQFVEHKEPR